MEAYLVKLNALSTSDMVVVRDGDNVRVEFVFTRGSRNSWVESNEEVLQERLNAAAGDGPHLVDVAWRGFGGSDYGPWQITAHVVQGGELTRIAEATLEAMQVLEYCGVLDEFDWSEREQKAIAEAIADYAGDQILEEWRAGEFDGSYIAAEDTPAELPTPSQVDPDLCWDDLAEAFPSLHEYLTRSCEAQMSDSGEY